MFGGFSADSVEIESFAHALTRGSTEADASKHFLGWLGDVDPDVLFASGEAWGISVIRKPV